MRELAFVTVCPDDTYYTWQVHLWLESLRELGKSDRAVVIVATLLLIAVVSMGYGVYKLFHATKGQDCQIEVQFQDSKATYIGKTV